MADIFFLFIYSLTASFAYNVSLLLDRFAYRFIELEIDTYMENPRGVVANVLSCNIVVSAFEFQSRYYIHFQTNTLGGNV